MLLTCALQCCRLLKSQKMRSFIAIALFSSVVLAATIEKKCKPNCMKDCMKAGSEDVWGTNCVMIFGNGPNGQGWYWFDDEGNDHLGSPMPVGRCQESCWKTCNNICSPEGEGGDGQVAADRGYGYGGYGGYRGGRGYGRTEG